ncbi:extracellular solute-binding protein [Paenibacillus sp. GCM10027628]|uniref:extracellular solute-binding protein n=1 Tax=Paenibacillus sp. GCM10027628 TaxID=3273413 RepID=UPI003630CCC4
MSAATVLSACSGQNGSTDNGLSQSSNVESGQTASNEPKGAPSDPFGKYDPPIEVSFVRNLSDVVENNVLGVLKGETFEDNRWTRLFKDQLGIKIKNNWVVKGDDTSEQYLQKLNVTIASGDIPDFMSVNSTQLKQLANAGQIEDMTTLYPQYASPDLKWMMSQEGTAPFDAATFNGKLMAIPLVDSSIESAMLIWIRTDWLQKLGLKPPKTMADVQEISKAFAEGDPEGNGKKDTFGLGVAKTLWGGAMGLEGFMAGYKAYPNKWVEGSSGKLVYGSVQPEVKKALQVLQTMFQNGELDQEFGMKDGTKVSEQIAAGKIGMEYGEQWNSIWPLQLNRNKDPNAQWQAFPIVSESGESPKVPLKFNTVKFFVVKKGAKHPEAVIKMFNLFYEKNWGKTAEFDKYYAPPEAESVWQLSPVNPSPIKKNVEAYRAIDAARKSGNFSALAGEAKTIQGKIDAYHSGSKDGFALWGWERIYGSEGSEGVVDQYDKNNQFLQDKFYGAPTPTMVERKSTLEKLQNETFTKIIMGAPIDDFDKFVQNWAKLGGAQMTKEINDWYATIKK